MMMEFPATNDRPIQNLTLVPVREPLLSDSRPPLFLVPGAAFIYKTFSNLTKNLSPAQPVYAFQSTDQQAAHWLSVEQLAARCISLMRAVRSRGPYWLGGYSIGAQIAFEMARQLQAQTETVELLINFDQPAPARYLCWKTKTLRTLSRLRHWPRVYELELNYRVQGALNRYFWLPDRDKIRWLIWQLKNLLYRQTPAAVSPPIQLPGIDPKFMQRNIQLSRSYLPRLYHGSMLVYKTTRGIAYYPAVLDPALRWGNWVRGPLETFLIDGDHTNIMRQPQIEIIAADLEPRLARLRDRR